MKGTEEREEKESDGMNRKQETGTTNEMTGTEKQTRVKRKKG